MTFRFALFLGGGLILVALTIVTAYAPVLLFMDLLVFASALLWAVAAATAGSFALCEDAILPQFRRWRHVLQRRRTFPYADVVRVDSKEDDTPAGQMWAFKFILKDGTWIYVRRMPEYPPQTYDALKVIQSSVNSGLQREIPQRLRELLQGDHRTSSVR